VLGSNIAAGFIVSQDGEVKAVKADDGQLFFGMGSSMESQDGCRVLPTARAFRERESQTGHASVKIGDNFDLDRQVIDGMSLISWSRHG
jgi:hypothetical protein